MTTRTGGTALTRLAVTCPTSGHGNGTTTGTGAILTVITSVVLSTIEYRRVAREGILIAMVRQEPKLRVDRILIPTTTDMAIRIAVISFDLADRGSRRVPLRILRLTGETHFRTSLRGKLRQPCFSNFRISHANIRIDCFF